MMYPRRTPIHEALQPLNPTWGDRFGMQVALQFGEVEQERQAVRTLAVSDLSALPRIGCKGPGAAAWLEAHGLPVPDPICGWERLDGEGIVARVDRSEFFLEDGLPGGPVGGLMDTLGHDEPGVYRVERQQAAFLLTGARAPEILAQTCAYDFDAGGTGIIRTRIAVTSCMVLPQIAGGIPMFRLWCEPSYGVYLWATLLDIARDLGGAPVGWHCLETDSHCFP